MESTDKPVTEQTAYGIFRDPYADRRDVWILSNADDTAGLARVRVPGNLAGWYASEAEAEAAADGYIQTCEDEDEARRAQARHDDRVQDAIDYCDDDLSAQR